jgi:glucose-1-phosphate cytidylyltransferase
MASKIDKNIPVVILAGGLGTRLKEETEFRPKPMVEIGNKPILWHIMKIYAYYGFKEFIICLGYKGEMIKEYFLNYAAMNNDFTVNLNDKRNIKYHTDHLENDWKVTLVNTGEGSQTGARVKKIENYINEDTFMLTYGDGVANVDIRKLVDFHLSQGRIGTITAVHPSSRFGELIIEGKRAKEFNEKSQTTEGFINGGFFVFNKSFLNYLSSDPMCILEKKPLEKLAQEEQLAVYKHEGFWQCMDTQRELNLLNTLWKNYEAAWKVW